MQVTDTFTPLQRDGIQAAAAKILAHPSFRASERSARLFRYLLERSFTDDAVALKERQIGHDVFGREIGYDTAADPIVRNAASETRRRLRQYEAEVGADEPVHIQLASGTYVLEFRFSEPETSSVLLPLPGSTVIEPTVDLAASNSKQKRHIVAAYTVAVVAVLACLGFAIAFYHQKFAVEQAQRAPHASSALWNPMLTSGKEIFISLGHAEPLISDDPPQSSRSGLERVTVTDLKAYTSISGFLQLNSHPFQMRTDNHTSLLDLRDRPVVLIGIHNNDWTLRLLGTLRYHFDYSNSTLNSDSFVSIVDSEHPEQSWHVLNRLPGGPSVDYALAGRVFHPVTGGPILFVAGAGSVGTQAAAEFVTQPQYLSHFPESLKDSKANIQFVLKIPVVAGIAGTPEVVATHTW